MQGGGPVQQEIVFRNFPPHLPASIITLDNALAAGHYNPDLGLCSQFAGWNALQGITYTLESVHL